MLHKYHGAALIAGLLLGGCATTGMNAPVAEPAALKNVQTAYQRIEANDKQGAKINAVIAANKTRNMAEAAVSDAASASGVKAGPLEGVPILIKDNIETADMPTTAGSLALKGNQTGRDAPLVTKLREAGAIIIGKTNLSEWANIRSTNSTSGWSAVGGLTRNPHSKAGEMRNSCGSSSGSGAAVGAGFVDAAIGTETDGSIVCPAGVNGIVGMKPTVGLVSRTHIVPISATQDTAGPMTADVMMAARILAAISGSDPLDPATVEADAHKRNYPALLTADTAGLSGLKLGVVRASQGDNPDIISLFDAALARMKAAGAILVEIKELGVDEEKLGELEFALLLRELKRDMAGYLENLPDNSPIKHRTLADLIAFNKAHVQEEMTHFDQNIFVMAETDALLCPPKSVKKTSCDPQVEYRRAVAAAKAMAGSDGIDRLLEEHKVDLLVQPTNGPAWLSTLGKGDTFTPPSASQLPAVAGYPHLTVPMGATKDGLPIGLSFIGPKWADALVLKAGYAFERAGPPLKVAPAAIASPKP